MVQINTFICSPEDADPVKYLHPKEGDVVWVRLTEADNESMRQTGRAVNEALGALGLKGKVAVVVSIEPHDLRLLDDDAMERLGWVRKKGT